MKILAPRRESSAADETCAPHLEAGRSGLGLFQAGSSGRNELELIPLRPHPGFARLFRERSGGNEEAGSENDRLESS